MGRGAWGAGLLAALLAGCATVPELQPRDPRHSYASQMRQAAEMTGPRGERGAPQLVAALQAMLGDLDGAISAFDASQPSRPQTAIDLSQDQAEDALAAIVREAALHRIVILNESHHLPLNRAFAMRLARELRKQGFEYLACETFRRGADPNPGVVDMASGAYLQDPVYAGFIREAKRDGWTLVAYEADPSEASGSPVERIRQRERGQARHLVEQVLSRHPAAKLFVYTGPGHALETPQRVSSTETVLWMAGELKAMSGLDPLTIDQSVAVAHPDPAREAAGYRAALARHAGPEPFVLRKADGSARLLQYAPGSVDLQVIHPPQALVSGRPAWLASWAHRQPFPIPEAWLPTQGRRLIYALHRTHPANAVPADLVIVEAGKPAPALMLPPGEFRFEFEPF